MWSIFNRFFLHSSKSFRNSPCHFTSRNLILFLSTVKKTNGPLSHFIFCVHCFPFLPSSFISFLRFLSPAVAFPFFIFYSHTAVSSVASRTFSWTRVNFVEGMSAKGQETRDSPFIHPISFFFCPFCISSIFQQQIAPCLSSMWFRYSSTYALRLHKLEYLSCKYFIKVTLLTTNFKK